MRTASSVVGPWSSANFPRMTLPCTRLCFLPEKLKMEISFQPSAISLQENLLRADG
jgi:hypothetical protein